MARRYKRKTRPLKNPGASFKVLRKHDGRVYVNVEFPLSADIEGIKWLIGDRVMWYREARKEGWLRRGFHGERTQRREYFRRKYAVVREAFAEANAKAIHRTMIPDFINGALAMRHMQPLSDSRIRAILASR